MATVIDRDMNSPCDKAFYVYAHARADNGEIFYIGKGLGNRAWRPSGRNRHWSNVASKYGYKVTIIHEGLTEKEAFDLEIKKISDIGIENLCNYALGGGGSSGYKLTELQKAKQIAALIGRNVSRETREKIAAAHTGRVHTETSRLLMSAARKGKKRSAESIKKQSESMLRRVSRHKNEIYGAMMKSIRCSNGLEFKSLAEAAIWARDSLGEPNAKSAISKCASGKRKTAYGLEWSYDGATQL